ncbi:MAG TPA: chemotaxis protein CheW [Thermoanaerobaculia bacterium]|nr:chemotaxis protein CheW [Thermoanaerobaculia bacterium]
MSDTTQLSQYLTFAVAGEEYAIPILRVREILEYSRLTRVPSTPSYIRGVINLRGSVVPVIDLAVKFGFAESAITRTTCIVVVEIGTPGETTIMGVIADSVRQVVELGQEAIEESPSFGVHGRVDFLLGMGIVDGAFVLLLDIDRVLSSTEIFAAIEAGSPAPDPPRAEGDAVPAPGSAP